MKATKDLKTSAKTLKTELLYKGELPWAVKEGRWKRGCPQLEMADQARRALGSKVRGPL